MNSVYSFINQVVKYLFYISTLIIFFCVLLSRTESIRIANIILLVTNIVSLYPLYLKLRNREIQIIDPIIYIMLYFSFAYVWNSVYQMNSDYFIYKLAHSQYRFQPFKEGNNVLFVLFLLASVMLQLGYWSMQRILNHKQKPFALHTNEIESLGHNFGMFEFFYLVLIIIKTYLYFTGQLGSAGNQFVTNIFYSAINILLLYSSVFLIITFIKHYDYNKLFFYFCFFVEFSCFMISGNRRDCLYMIIAIMICAVSKGININIKSLSKYALLFFLIIWPLLNLGNDLANYKMSKSNSRINLKVEDLVNYISSDKKEKISGGKQSAGIIRIVSTEHLTQNIVAYDNMYKSGYKAGPVGLYTIFSNILPSFLMERTNSNLIDIYQQYAYKNFTKMRTVLAFDLIAELIMSYGPVGVLFIFFSGALWAYLFYLFSNATIFYKLIYLSNYYRFSFGIFDNRVVGDTVVFVKLMFLLLIIAIMSQLLNIKFLQFKSISTQIDEQQN